MMVHCGRASLLRLFPQVDYSGEGNDAWDEPVVVAEATVVDLAIQVTR